MPGSPFEAAVALAGLTSMGVGGSARRAIRLPSDVQRAQTVLAELSSPPTFVLGGGTNVLAADDGTDELVAYFDDHHWCEDLGNGKYRVSANLPLGDLVTVASAAGWFGVERLAGIPGSVGGAVVQNAGAYHQELGHRVIEVEWIRLDTGEAGVFTQDECGFGYRDSRFKRAPGRWLIVRCTVQLLPTGELPESAEVLAAIDIERAVEVARTEAAVISAAIVRVREGKDHILSSTSRSAGSFFMNPRFESAEPELARIIAVFETRRDAMVAAGADWIRADADPRRYLDGDVVELIAGFLIGTATDVSELDRAFSPGRTFGALRLGSAGANTIINDADATAAEVVALARDMRSRVSTAFGIALQLEVVLLGDIAVE